MPRATRQRQQRRQRREVVMAPTSPPTDKTGFFDLPRELRDEIYGIVLADRDFLICRGCKLHKSDALAESVQRFQSLRNACQQTRTEVSERFLSMATVHFNLVMNGLTYKRPRECNTGKTTISFFLMQEAQRFRFKFEAPAEHVPGPRGRWQWIKVAPKVTAYLNVIKRDETFSADVVFESDLNISDRPNQYFPNLTERSARMARDEELGRRLVLALQEPLSKMNESGMVHGFLKKLPYIIKKADEFNVSDPQKERLYERWRR